MDASFGRLILIYLRIGNTTFGGGEPTMAALRHELMDRRRWLDRLSFELAYALTRVTPGTNMLAFCAGTAWAMAGWTAAIAAVLVVTVPSAALVVALTAGYDTWKSNAPVNAAINGTLAAAIGMMGGAAWLLARPHVLGPARVRAVVLVAAAIAASLFTSASPLQIIAGAAIVAYLWPGSAR